jgi:hypothetical protein
LILQGWEGAISGGLDGSYYNNRWLFGTTPAMNRIDNVIDFTWDDFVTSTGKDFISVRWTGFVQPAFSEAYKFHMQVNDGVRLWINGMQLIDEYEATVEDADDFAEYTAVTAPLTADRLYSVKIEFRENKGCAVARFLWSSTTQPKTVVPHHRLYHNYTEVNYASPFGNVCVGGGVIIVLLSVPFMPPPSDCVLFLYSNKTVRDGKNGFQTQGKNVTSNYKFHVTWNARPPLLLSHIPHPYSGPLKKE